MGKLTVLLVLLVLASCGSSSGGQDPVAEDATIDLGAAGDASETKGADQLSDMGADAPATDVATDLPLEPLPSLPPNKSFSTRYAAGAHSAPANPSDPVGRYLAGFGFCAGKDEACRKSEGQHDDMMVSAVALADPQNGEVVIFVGVDSVGMIKYDIKDAQQRAVERFEKELGVHIDGDRIVVACSHTHGGIDTVGLWGPMLIGAREEEAYIDHLKTVIVDVSLTAFQNLDDVELDWGTSSSPNGDKDLADDDETVWTLRGRKGDQTVFTLTRWVGHPTKYGSESNAVSADWVGPFRETMVAETGAVAVYLNGPVGSVYPDLEGECTQSDFFPDGFQDPDVSAEDHGKVGCYGVQVAQAALAALEQTKPLADSGIWHRYAEFDFHPDNVVLAAVLSLSSVPWDLVEPGDPDAVTDSRFSWTTIGDLQYLTTPGETFPSMAYKAADLLSAAGYDNAIVIGVSQDWMGYLLTAEQWPQENLSYYRSLSPGPDVEPAYMKRLEDLIEGN